MKNFKFAAILSALTFVGCSDDSSDSPRNNGLKPNDGEANQAYEINGKTPSEFYAQFYYKEGRKRNQNGEFDVFSYVDTRDKKVGEVLEDEDQKCASFKIAVYEDKTYIVNYEEGYCIQSSEHPHTWDPVFEKKLFGKWSIDGMDLVLGNFAVATGFKYNGEDSLGIQLTSDINREMPPKTNFIGYYLEESVFAFDED